MPLKRVRKQAPKVFIRQWILALGRKSTDVARAAQITESYLSEINSEKKTPSRAVVADIAAALGVTSDDLHRQPPPNDALAAVRGLQPEILGQLLHNVRKPPHK